MLLNMSEYNSVACSRNMMDVKSLYTLYSVHLIINNMASFSFLIYMNIQSCMQLKYE